MKKIIFTIMIIILFIVFSGCGLIGVSSEPEKKPEAKTQNASVQSAQNNQNIQNAQNTENVQPVNKNTNESKSNNEDKKDSKYDPSNLKEKSAVDTGLFKEISGNPEIADGDGCEEEPDGEQPPEDNGNNSNNGGNKKISEFDAVQIVNDHIDVLPDGGRLEYDGPENFEGKDYHVIHGYSFIVDDEETGEGHTATFGWYYVDISTGVPYEMDMAQNKLIQMK